MAVEIVDMLKMAQEGKRKVLFNTKRFSTWVHVYPTPGQKMDMHCHNHDETFYVVDGELTMHFPDGGKAVMKAGMVALIPGGSFYQLENSGQGPLALMGNRGGSQDDSTYVHYETRKTYKGRGGYDEANPAAADRVRTSTLAENQREKTK